LFLILSQGHLWFKKCILTWSLIKLNCSFCLLRSSLQRSSISKIRGSWPSTKKSWHWKCRPQRTTESWDWWDINLECTFSEVSFLYLSNEPSLTSGNGVRIEQSETITKCWDTLNQENRVPRTEWIDRQSVQVLTGEIVPAPLSSVTKYDQSFLILLGKTSILSNLSEEYYLTDVDMKMSANLRRILPSRSLSCNAN
jgi:hypothetical protein